MEFVPGLVSSKADGGGGMITIAEFRTAFRRQWIRYLSRIGGVFALGASVFLVLWLLLEVFDQRDDATLRAEAAMAVAIIVAIVAVGRFVRTADQDARDDPRLICPWCDSPLGSYEGIIVLSSRSCPSCGERVLED
jgi:heme A synthase